MRVDLISQNKDTFPFREKHRQMPKDEAAIVRVIKEVFLEVVT